MSTAAQTLRDRADKEPGSRQALEALALADLLDALHTAIREGRDGARIDYFAEWRRLEAAINGSDEAFTRAIDDAFRSQA